MRISSSKLSVLAGAALLAIGASFWDLAASEPRPSDRARAETPARTPSPRFAPTEINLVFVPKQRLSEQEAEYLSILQRPQTTDIRIAQIQVRVDDFAWLRLDLGDGDPMLLHRAGGGFEGEGSFTWFGETADRRGTAILAVRSERLHGVVYSQGRMTRIAPLGQSSHAVWQVRDTVTDSGRCVIEPGSPRFQQLFGSTHGVHTTPARTAGTPARTPAQRTKPGDPNAEIAGFAEFRLLAVYSDSAASLTPDIVGHIELLVAWANASYVNSQIEAASGGPAPRMTLAAAVQAEFSEFGGDNGYLLWRFTNPNDSELGFVHDVRDSLEADVCVLLTGSNNPDNDGLAMGGPPDPTTAFCLVETPYSLVFPYIFAHEVGHLQNAHHSDYIPPWAPPYARGYCYNPVGYPEHGFTTIMCVYVGHKIPYWSNPNVTYEPTPGALFPTGDAEHFNARVLGETALVVASHRGDPVVPVAVTDLEALSFRDRIQLRWGFSEETLRGDLGVEVQRADAIEGPYANRTQAPLVAESRMTFEDTEVFPGQTYWYRLGLLGHDGAPDFVGPVHATILPWQTALLSCTESPSADAVRVSYIVGPETTDVRLHIYDVRGRLVRTLDHGSRPAGRYTDLWDRRDQTGKRVVRGIYMARLSAGDAASVGRIVLARE